MRELFGRNGEGWVKVPVRPGQPRGLPLHRRRHRRDLVGSPLWLSDGGDAQAEQPSRPSRHGNREDCPNAVAAASGRREARDRRPHPPSCAAEAHPRPLTWPCLVPRPRPCTPPRASATRRARVGGPMSACRRGERQVGGPRSACRLGEGQVRPPSWPCRRGEGRGGGPSWPCRRGEGQVGGRSWPCRAEKARVGPPGWMIRVGEAGIWHGSWRTEALQGGARLSCQRRASRARTARPCRGPPRGRGRDRRARRRWRGWRPRRG